MAMSFIRAKEIPPHSGNWYDYEVESVWNKGKVIQKHIRYIGRSTRMGSRVLGGVRDISPLPVVTSQVMPIQSDDNIPKMKTPANQIASAMGMYYGGMSLDAVQQQFRQDFNTDMSESNYWNWVKRFTKEAIRQCKDFKPEVGNTWVADETYMKLGKRKVYFWDIIDADTRYLLATHVSFTRGGRDAKQLMDLAQNRAGKTPKVVITDKLASYIVGV